MTVIMGNRRRARTGLSVNHVKLMSVWCPAVSFSSEIIVTVFVCIKGHNIKIWDLACVFHSERRACVWFGCVCALLIERGMVQAWECCLLRKNKLLSLSVPLSYSASPCNIGLTWWGGKEKWQDKSKLEEDNMREEFFRGNGQTTYFVVLIWMTCRFYIWLIL